MSEDLHYSNSDEHPKESQANQESHQITRKILLIEKKIEKVRSNVLLKQMAALFSIQVTLLKSFQDSQQKFSQEVESTKTKERPLIIVSELDSIEDVEYQFQLASLELPSDAQIVNTKWLSDCIRNKKLVAPEQRYFLGRKFSEKPLKQQFPANETPSNSAAATAQSEFLCQMRCPLEHHNSKLTAALSILARNAEHQHGITKDQQYYAKALAFDRAAACLKSLNYPLTSVNQLLLEADGSAPRYLGDHALRVVKELLTTGASTEVDAVTQSELYQAMSSLTSVYGVGQALAYKWYCSGVRTPSEAAERLLLGEQAGGSTGEDRSVGGLPTGGGDQRRLQTGLAFHADLNQPVTLDEANRLRNQVANLLADLRGPGYTVVLVGGFSRGKSSGHDCDLLITHDIDGAEAGAVADVAKALSTAGRVLHGAFEANSFSPSVLSRDFRVKELRSTLDHFEKWLGVVKLCSKNGDGDGDDLLASDADPAAKRRALSPNYCAFDTFGEAMALSQTKERDWLARRVDLIGVPRSQYAYALLGWTGNRLFNRDLRLFAQRHRRMKLTSHGLFDLQKEISLPASSEEEIFQHLGLEYIPPKFRNC